MALVECPDCGKMISEYAPICIGCGRPKGVSTPQISPPAPAGSVPAPPPVSGPVVISPQFKNTKRRAKSRKSLTTRDYDAAIAWDRKLDPANRQSFVALAKMTPEERKKYCTSCHGLLVECVDCDSKEEGLRNFILARWLKSKRYTPEGKRKTQKS